MLQQRFDYPLCRTKNSRLKCNLSQLLDPAIEIALTALPYLTYGILKFSECIVPGIIKNKEVVGLDSYIPAIQRSA